MEWSAKTDKAFEYVEAWVKKAPIHKSKFISSIDMDEVIHSVGIEELDPIHLIIYENIFELVNPNRWMVWTAYCTNDIVVATPDEDYRIKIFNEKKESNEW